MQNYIFKSFDCATRNMGIVCATSIFPDIVQINHLKQLYNDIQTVDNKSNDNYLYTKLSDMIGIMANILNDILKIEYIAIKDLGEKNQAWEISCPLKICLNELDAKIKNISTEKFNGDKFNEVALYEFQMSANDKSRMISSMIAYHYSDIETVRIPPSLKNLIKIGPVSKKDFTSRCPITSKKKIKNPITKKMELLSDNIFRNGDALISIQSFLPYFSSTYKANKTHTGALLEWWCSVFNFDLKCIPKDCLDDAADAFIQIIAHLRKM